MLLIPTNNYYYTVTFVRGEQAAEIAKRPNMETSAVKNITLFTVEDSIATSPRRLREVRDMSGFARYAGYHILYITL